MTEGGEFRQLLLVSGGRWGVSGERSFRDGPKKSNSQSLAHLIECALSLVEEAVHNALAEVAIVIVIHLEDLFESGLVDTLAHVVEGGRCLLGLGGG